MPRKKKETEVKETKKRGRKPKVKVPLDLANKDEVFGVLPEDKQEPMGKFTEVKKPTAKELAKRVVEYEFETSDDVLFVKYKYHKRSTRYNALRNVTNEPPRPMNDEKYKYWINEKCQRYNPYYNMLDYQMSTAVPERIQELIKYLVVYTKPDYVEKKVYELHVSRILCYIAKSVIDKYFFDKIPHINEWLAPENLEHVDLLTAFNEGVSDFCIYVKKEDDGKLTHHRAWDDKMLHLPAYNAQWLTKTDRVFRFKISKAGDSYRTFLGICLKDEGSKYWSYFNDDHVNGISDEVDKLVMGKELNGLYKGK